MGTNYYFETGVCRECGKPDERRHIGKSSGGWCFSLHIYPEDGINDLDDWKRVFDEEARHERARIVDEYGRQLSVPEMLVVITERRWRRNPTGKPPEPYASWEVFYQLNSAEAWARTLSSTNNGCRAECSYVNTGPHTDYSGRRDHIITVGNDR